MGFTDETLFSKSALSFLSSLPRGLQSGCRPRGSTTRIGRLKAAVTGVEAAAGGSRKSKQRGGPEAAAPIAGGPTRGGGSHSGAQTAADAAAWDAAAA